MSYTTKTIAGGYALSDDPAHFDLVRAHHWISVESYWAKGIPLAVFGRAVRHSMAISVYTSPENGPKSMVAMARVVTDRATFGWICDVFVDQGHRGAGLGKAIMAYLKAHPDLQGLRRLHLATADAHGLYAQFGFGPLKNTDRWMEIWDPEVYARLGRPG
jgi:GNAT superfamily N-acetyltransferase